MRMKYEKNIQEKNMANIVGEGGAQESVVSDRAGKVRVAGTEGGQLLHH